MELSPVGSQPVSTATATNSSSRGVISSDFETFLKMLTVQMKNQDPLDPIKSEDYAVQLATFSGVEQQVQTNDLLTDLAAQINVSGMAQIAGWVGMEGRAAVPAQFNGAPITLSPNPEFAADAAVLVVRDANGNEVQRVSVPVAANAFEWSGTLDDGTTAADGIYSFSVESFTNGALTSTNPVEVYARIVEARSQDGQTVLVTDSGAEVPATSVTAIREPGGG